MVDGIVASWVMFAVVLFWTGSAVSCAMDPIPVSEDWGFDDDGVI